jgi:hypothetical protein
MLIAGIAIIVAAAIAMVVVAVTIDNSKF